MKFARFILLLLIFSAEGCGRRFSNTEIDPWVSPSIIQAEIADEFYGATKSTLRFDWFMIENLEIAGQGRFIEYFGGSDARAAAQYVASGVKFVSPISSSQKALLINYGIGLYLEKIADPTRTRFEWSRGRYFDPNRPDNGLIGASSLYFAARNLIRVAGWPHERRHGDCDSPPTRQATVLAIAQLEEKKDPGADFRSCGHQHVFCPSGHSLEGQAGCDDQEDGAYAYGLEWIRAVRDTCKNCASDLRTMAEALVIEYESRILRP